jgi:hypothetical protein
LGAGLSGAGATPVTWRWSRPLSTLNLTGFQVKSEQLSEI